MVLTAMPLLRTTPCVASPTTISPSGISEFVVIPTRVLTAVSTYCFVAMLLIETLLSFAICVPPTPTRILPAIGAAPLHPSGLIDRSSSSVI